MIVRNFQKGRMHNLYDKNKHTALQGVLFFYTQDIQKASPSEENFVHMQEKREIHKKVSSKPHNEIKTLNTVESSSGSDPVREFLENTQEKSLDKHTSFVDRFFAIAFRIDRVVISLFKLLLRTFDAIFSRVDRAIYWFDQVIVEQKRFRSIPFKFLWNKVPKLSLGNKKNSFDAAVKKAIEVSNKEKQNLTSDEDKQSLTSDEDKQSLTSDEDKQSLTSDEDKQSLTSDEDKQSLTSDEDKQSLTSDEDKKKKESARKTKLSFSLPRINFSYLFLAYPKIRLIIAAIFFLISLGSISLLMFPLVSAEVSSIFQMSSNKPTPSPTPIRYNSYYQEEKDKLYPITEFRLSVPKINLESNIVDNVDPKIEDEYKEKLQFGVAHAKGSYLPPENGPVYLFAHSTDTIFNIARFNAKFYSVRELEKGDEIKVYFNGKEYRYIVEDKYVINPKEVDIIQQAKTDLILQTCWPPGTDWQRLIVLANLVDSAQTI